MALNKNKVGLAVGIFIALIHAIWALSVAVGITQALLDWIFPLHFLDSIYSVTSFSIVSALLLVVMSFIGGYVMGWVYAFIYNKVAK